MFDKGWSDKRFDHETFLNELEIKMQKKHLYFELESLFDTDLPIIYFWVHVLKRNVEILDSGNFRIGFNIIHQKVIEIKVKIVTQVYIEGQMTNL